MRIKRTFAPTMRDALQLVKQEQGPDAVILGNKKVPGGVEILSAIDFDEAAISSMAAIAPAPRREQQVVAAPIAAPTAAMGQVAVSDVASDAWVGSILDGDRKEPTLGTVAAQRSPVQVAAAVTEAILSTVAASPRRAVQPDAEVQAAVARSRTRSKAVAAAARKKQQAKATAVKAAAVKAAAVEQANAKKSAMSPDILLNQPQAGKPAIDEVKIELQNLRDLMESQLSVLQWDRFSQKHPVRTVLLNLMSEMGLGADICETVLSHLNELDGDPHKVWQHALAILSRCVPINRRDLLAEGGRIALVGSTGVGKTTTIAKLAARFAHTHGKRSVAIISTDQFRIGAQEQLQHYARLLEVPLLMAGNSEELCDRLDMLADKKLVLIDTAGMSQRDLKLSEQFHKLQLGSPEIKPYLVLSANTQLAALNQTILNFSKVKLAGAFVTKLDEAASLGGIITASIRHQLVLAYCGTGQKVPEDLEPAKSHRLISKAVALMRRYGEQFDQEALALRYNHIINKNQA
jgi:flagellar biosynthesis protein FlhF